MTVNLDGYVPVAVRLQRALERWPELRVAERPWRTVELNDRLFLECTVAVHRTADDPMPVIGTVLEPWPGRTPYTRDSELMVGMTSALGRALGYLGLGLEHGLASADEVLARTGPTTERGGRPHSERLPEPEAELATGPVHARPRPPSEAMLNLLRNLLAECGVTLEPEAEHATLARYDACKAEIERLKALKRRQP